MKLRFDLLEFVTDEDFMEAVLANNHRYKAEPLLAKTGVGYLAPATPEEREQEMARSQAFIQRLLQRKHEAEARKSQNNPSPNEAPSKPTSVQ